MLSLLLGKNAPKVSTTTRGAFYFMAKRFTDSEKWKKPFIKQLPVHLKLLWFYILDDCDIAGLWQVDIEIAQLRIGAPINEEEAISAFGDAIIRIDDGEKWFIPSFLEFQYGSQLSKTNNVYKSIERILSKYDLFKYLDIEITDSGTTINSYRNRISSKVRDSIFLKSEFVCQYCSEQKQKSELVIDHFIPLNKGGDNSDENLVCSCVRCNSHKTDILPDIFLSKGHSFLNPTKKIELLLASYKSLKAPFKKIKGAKDMDKDKEMDKDKDKDKDKKADFDFPKSDLDIAFDNWVAMRKKMKGGITDHAIELGKKELQELSNGNANLAIAIINRSILNSWKGFFPLSNKSQANGNSKEAERANLREEAIAILTGGKNN